VNADCRTPVKIDPIPAVTHTNQSHSHGKPVLCVPIPTGNNLQFTCVSPVPVQLSTTTVSIVHHVNVPQNTVKLPLPIVHCTIQQYCRTVNPQRKIKSCKYTIQGLSQPYEHQVFVH